MNRILVVDDEASIVKGIKFSLEQEGTAVDSAYDGEEALELARKTHYDLIILDVMLPKLDGLGVCQQIREFSSVPVIMLTARGEDMDKIMGLEYGADDYMTKPFNILELKARVKAIFRRAAKSAQPDVSASVIKVRDLEISADSRRVTMAGREIQLTAKEFDMLEMFVKNPGKVYTREGLLEAVWNGGSHADARTVDVHVRRLREKIEHNPSEPQYIHTKWGVGYYFR
jgi:DNA-binding response OmpR family regulator